MMFNEQWKEVKDYPNYEISNRGRVRSKARRCRYFNGTRKLEEKMMKPSWNGDKVRYGLSNHKGRRMIQIIHLMSANWSRI